MNLTDIDYVEINFALEAVINFIEGPNLGPKRRSRITAKDQRHRPTAKMVREGDVLGITGGNTAQACEGEIRSGRTLGHRVGIHAEQSLEFSHCLGVCERLGEILGQNSGISSAIGVRGHLIGNPLEQLLHIYFAHKALLPQSKPREIPYPDRMRGTSNAGIRPSPPCCPANTQLPTEGRPEIDFDPALQDPNFESGNREPIAVPRPKPGANVKLPTVSPASNGRPFQRAFTQREIRMGASIFHGMDFTVHAKKADIDPLDLYAEATVTGDPIRFCDSLVCQWRAFVQ